MNQAKPNPDELQPQGMSDEDVERQVNNYVVMEELETFDPAQVTWQPMKDKQEEGKGEVS